MSKTKVIEFNGCELARFKIIIEDKVVEQVNEYNFLGCRLSYLGEIDVKHKLARFNHTDGTLFRTFKNKVRKDIMIKF